MNAARRAAACAIAFGLGLGMHGPTSAQPRSRTVEITRFAFAPSDITVEPGTRVRWVNRDETPHTVTSAGTPAVLASPGLDLDDPYEFVFTTEGDYPYLCTVHPMMRGMVHVRAAGSGH